MKSRRVPFVRLLFIAGILCLLGAVYLRIGLFPGRLLNKALVKIEESTHKKVLCDKILFIPFRGFTFDGLKIYENDGALLFSADSLTLNVRVLPFFREKKIIIDRFIIDSPAYDYTLEPETAVKQAPPKTVISGQIDVPVIPDAPRADLKDLANGPDFFLPENVYLEGIEITDGDVFVRKSKSEAPVERIRSINVRMGFQKPPVLAFDGQFKLGDGSYATVDLKGHWNLKNGNYDFNFSTLAQKMPDWLLDYQKGHFLSLRQGQFSLKTHLVSGKGGDALFQCEAHLKNALMQVSASQFSGQMHLKAQGVFDTAWKRFEKYKGSLELVHVDASHLSSKIERLDNLSGFLSFEPDLLTVQSLRGEYKKLPFDASGSVRSFRELSLEGQVRSRMSIEQLLALLPPEASEKIQGFKIRGDCEAVTLLDGTLKSPPRIETETMVQLSNASVQNAARHIDWSGLSGQLRMNAKGIEISRARFSLSGSPVSLDAFIPKIESAPGWFHVISKELEIKSGYTLHGSDLWLEDSKASLPGATASFSGKLLQWNDPVLQLQGEAEISLERLAQKWGAQAPALRSWDPQGTLRGPFVLNGPWKTPLDWEFKMDAKSPLLRLKKNFRLEETEVQVRMKNRLLNVPYVHADFEGGTLGARLLFDLTKPGTFFDSRVYLNNVDVARLGASLEPPKKDVSGTLIGQLAMRGTLQKPESYRGQGALSIMKGKLWQTTQFKAMGNLPLVKVEGLELVTFHDLSATYEIHDKKVHTKDLTLLGDAVNLSLHGTLSFDSQLDMVMSIQYSEDVYRGADYTGGIVPLVLSQAGNLISEYHVHGSLKEPKYDKMLLPSGRAIGKNIGGLLQNITS